MTFTYKLARRLARLRTGTALILPLLAACAAGEPFTPPDPSTDTGTDGSVALSPRQVTLEGSQGVLFRAFESLIPGSNQVTSIEWTTTGGSIGGDGSYKPTSTGAFKVVGRRKGNPHNTPDTSVVVVVPPQPTLVAIDLTPSTATVGGGLQEQFAVVGRRSDGTEVPIGVSWSTTGGTIDAGGLYTAGRTSGTYKVIATHVTTGLADTAVVTVPPATLTSISLTPSSVSLGAGQSQPFSVTGRLSDGTTTSSVPVAYSATGGSISVNGYYTAGSTAGTFRVIATAQGGKADSSAVTIASSWTGSLLYNADFESGGFPSGTGLVQCAPGRISVYSASSLPAGAPLPRRGTRAVKMRVLKTDVEPCTPTENPRAQSESPRFAKDGMELWYSFSIFMTSSFPTLNDFLIAQSLYSPLGGGEGAVGTKLLDGGANCGFDGAYNQSTRHARIVAKVPCAKGVWHDFLFHVKVSTDPSVGFQEIWHRAVSDPANPPGYQNATLSVPSGGVGTVSTVNGVSRLTSQTMLAEHAAGGADWRFSNYFGHLMDASELTLYYDEGRVGTTRAAVEGAAGASALLASSP